MTSAATRLASEGGAGVFRSSADGTQWIAEGALTYANAGTALAQAGMLRLPTSGRVDCGGVAAADSAAIAVLLALKRRANEAGGELVFVDAPAVLSNLARLYDVEGMLGT